MEGEVSQGWRSLEVRKPVFATERDERDDRTGVKLDRRKGIGFADVGDIDGLSGLRAGFVMIGGRVIGIDHDSSSGGGWRTGAVLVHRGRQRWGVDMEGRTNSNERSWQKSPMAYIIIQTQTLVLSFSGREKETKCIRRTDGQDDSET